MKSLDIVGIGDVELTISLGTERTLNDARVIPNPKRKIIYVGQLDDQGLLIW